MIQVTPRVRRHDDRAGDPLDGLVNLFDIGIVLSVGRRAEEPQRQPHVLSAAVTR